MEAFDTVNHLLGLVKLYAYGLSQQALYLLHSYFGMEWEE